MSESTYARAFSVLRYRDRLPLKGPPVLNSYSTPFSFSRFPASPHQSSNRPPSVQFDPLDPPFSAIMTAHIFPSSFPALFLGSHPATTPATSRNPLRRLTPAREEVAALPEKVAPCYPATCPRKSPERRSPCRAFPWLHAVQ